MAKQKIRQEIYNQYYSALEKGCIDRGVDKFCENCLLGDILGTIMRNNVLKVSDVLEA